VGSKAPGAVVIGGDYQGLGIARSLGRLGVAVCVIDDERSIARHSRYVTRSLRVPDLSDEAVLVRTLLEAGRRFELDGWVLYPTRDETVATISRHRDELAASFRVPTPGWETIRWASDKRNTYELAARLGIPVPGTHWPADEAELLELEIEVPAVVKPAVKEPFVRATGDKAWRADTRTDLLELFRRASAIVPPGQTMVQELIPGGGSQQYAYCAFFKDGDPVGSIQARRRRQHPWEFGRASTFVETVDVPEIRDHSLRFLRELDYYGLVELEYKLDARDGAFKLLDVNARTWGYHTLGAAAGVDFSAMLYHDQIGERIEPRRGRPGVKWLRLVTDVPTAIADVSARRISARSYVGSLLGVDVEAVWDRRDLRPWVAELALIPYLIAKRGF
jgi:D-aspartate ligase